MTERVVVAVIDDIFTDLKIAIAASGGFSVLDTDFIAIKPNLCDFRPACEGGTTDPRIVEAFIKIIREEANPKIAIVESNHAVGNANDEFERLGYRKLAQDLNVDLINLSEDERCEIDWDGYYFDFMDAPVTLLKSTKIVSISKLKTHAQQKMTCGMKNLFGLIPRMAKSRYHPYMNEVLADLAEFYKPSFSIIDGIVGMEGFGPSDGDKKNVGIVICGQDLIATDAVAARIMGFDAGSVPYLKYASRIGLGNIRNIEIIGDISSIKKFKFIPLYSYAAYRSAFILSRYGRKLGNLIEDISKFVSQSAVGFVVLRKGYFFTPEFGMLFRKTAISYIKGLIMRRYSLFKLKLYGILS